MYQIVLYCISTKAEVQYSWNVEEGCSYQKTYLAKVVRREDDFYGRRPLMEDNLWWRTTFDGRQPFMEDDLWWKMTIYFVRGPLWMTTFDGGFLQNDGCAASFWGRLHFWGCPNVWRRIHFWKMTFMEDDLWWKTTIDGSPYYCECMSFQVTSK